MLFLTYRLFGSLPRPTYRKVADERRRLKAEPPRPNESADDRMAREFDAWFAIADDMLDSARTNSQWLTRDDIALIILENIFFQAAKLYRLWAFAIMPTHVHALLEPRAQNSAAQAQITHALKNFTAHRANQVLNRHGAFWETETYTRWVRDAKDFERTAEYIERNPVKARLVKSPAQWRWRPCTFWTSD